MQGQGFICSSCPAGNYVFQQGGQCLKVDGCMYLSPQGVCLSCAAGYYLNQGLCSTCDVSCATCQDLSVCLTCASGFFNGTDVSHALCQACSLGCSSCSDASTCTGCFDNYRLNGAVCASCPANCATCSVATCLSCVNGAVQVGTNCYVCTDVSQQGSSGCISCISSGARV